MPQYVALLRGINVGGHRVKMDDLRALFEALKFSDVSTFIASGNVIFSARSGDRKALEKRIESHLGKSLGYGVDTFVRTPAELTVIAAFRPFGGVDLDRPTNTLHVGFLRDELPATAAKKIESLRTPRDELRVDGRQLYWLCRGKTTDSLIGWQEMCKVIAISCTMRNMKSVRKLAARLAE